MNKINMDEALNEISADLGFDSNVEGSDDSGQVPAVLGEGGLDDSQNTDDSTSANTNLEMQEGDPSTSQDSAGIEDTSTSSPEPPPKTWRQEAAALWNDLPPAVRAEVQKREEDMFKGIESYKQDANIGKALKDVVAPYLSTFREEGIDPMQGIQSLLHAHHTLVKGSDDQRREVFKLLLKEYRVNFSSEDLAGITSPPSPSDPHIQAVQKELAEIKSYVNNSQQQQLETVKENLRRDIEAFAADPANLHFNDVVNDMVQLIKSGVAKDLKDAYQQAIWVNPAVREKELARITAEKEATRQKESAEALEKARKASTINLRTKAKSRSGTAPTGTMDETLNETLKEIRSRSN